MKDRLSLELFISRFLTIGVLVSGLFILIAWSFTFKFSANPFFNFEHYDPIPLKDLLIFYFNKKDWFQLFSFLGFSLLIAIPFLRVLFMLFLYLKNKEFSLALISSVVFIGLLVGLALGIKL